MHGVKDPFSALVLGQVSGPYERNLKSRKDTVQYGTIGSIIWQQAQTMDSRISMVVGLI